MCRVADAQQSGLGPRGKPIDRHAQQFYILEGLEFFDAIGEKLRTLRDIKAECLDTATMDPIDAPHGDHEGTLPIVITIDGNDHLVGAQMTQNVFGIAYLLRQTKPQYVDGRSEGLDGKPGHPAHGGVTPIAADHEIGLDVEWPRRTLRVHPRDPAIDIDE